MQVIFDVCGYALEPDEDSSRAGWGALVRAGDATAEARDGLCSSCDPGAQTRNRADLRAVQWALHFVHEIADIGHPSGRCRNQRGRRGRARRHNGRGLADGQSLDPNRFKVTIRTASLYIIHGMQLVSQRKMYHDVWHEMDNTSSCLLAKGMQIEFEHVGEVAAIDEWNQRAQDLAKGAAGGEPHIDKFSRCVTCEIDFDDGFVTVASHFKDMHLDPAPDEEENTAVRAVQKETYNCKLCPRVLADGFALQQHLLDKHGL